MSIGQPRHEIDLYTNIYGILDLKKRTHRSYSVIQCFMFRTYGYIYLYMYKVGALGVMFIVVRNEHGDPSSNPGSGCSHFTLRFGKICILLFSLQI